MKNTSPFKFLNAYEKADRAIFFGRDKEIEQLYEMAHQSNLTLVYGRSGTGKTSLIQCGLANRFAASDWLDVFVRRKDNINDSLHDALSKQAQARESNSRSGLKDRLRQRRKSTQPDSTKGNQVSDSFGPVVTTLNTLYTQYFKPVYLIFDQFEELFILGEHDERQQFYNTITEIVDECPYCHVIFVLREESIAELYDFERILPTLFDKRLRVEPLSKVNAIEVVKSTTAKFEIELEDENVAETVIDAITSGRGQAELTYLQVFLDALYQQADSNPPVFTHRLVKKLGGISDVLADFLNVQSKQIQSDLSAEYSNVSGRSVQNVLSAFVTLEGTKQPMVLSHVNVPGLSSEQVEFCVKALEAARIFRFSDDRYELSHDALAARIAESRSSADIAFLEAVKLIKNRAASFQSTNTYLSASEIGFIEPFKKRIDEEGGLTPEQRQYIKESKKDNRRIRRKRNTQIAIAGTLLSIALITTVALWLGSRQANYERLLGMGDSAVDRNDFLAATLAYQEAINAKSASEEATIKLDSAENMKIIYDSFIAIVERADGLTLVDTNRTYLENCDSLLVASNLYSEALELDISRNARASAINKKQAVQNELKAIYGDLERRGNIMKNVDQPIGYANALVFYAQAQRIQPNSLLIQQKIDECLENMQE